MQTLDFFGTIICWNFLLITRLEFCQEHWWNFIFSLHNPHTYDLCWLQLDPYLLPVVQGRILLFSILKKFVTLLRTKYYLSYSFISFETMSNCRLLEVIAFARIWSCISTQITKSWLLTCKILLEAYGLFNYLIGAWLYILKLGHLSSYVF
jgi:hypothetical protein